MHLLLEQCFINTGLDEEATRDPLRIYPARKETQTLETTTQIGGEGEVDFPTLIFTYIFNTWPVQNTQYWPRSFLWFFVLENKILSFLLLLGHDGYFGVWQKKKTYILYTYDFTPLYLIWFLVLVVFR